MHYPSVISQSRPRLLLGSPIIFSSWWKFFGKGTVGKLDQDLNGDRLYSIQRIGAKAKCLLVGRFYNIVIFFHN